MSRNVYCESCRRGWNIHGAFMRHALLVEALPDEIDDAQIAWAKAHYGDQPFEIGNGFTARRLR